MTTHVFIVDDDKNWMKGIRWFIEKENDLAIVGTAETKAETLSGLKAKLNVDVVLLDIVLGEDNGVELIRPIRLHWPNAKILMMTSVDAGKVVRECMETGANDYVVKTKPHAFPAAIRRVISGHDGMDPSAVAALKREFAKQAELARNPELSPSEKQLLLMVNQGQSTRQIAAKLGVSQGTLRNYISKINLKFGTTSREEAATLAMELGVLE